MFALALLLAGPPMGAIAADAPAASPSVAPRSAGLVVPGALRLDAETKTRVRFIGGAPLEQFYPADAMARGLTGVVTLDLLIGADGTVLRTQVLGEEPANEGFGLAAMEAAKTFRFANGLLRPVLTSMQVRFSP